MRLPSFAIPRFTTAQIVKGAGVVLAFTIVASVLQFVVAVRALRAHLSAGPEWAFPSRVYSDALTFDRGKPLPPDYLASHLGLRGYRPARPPITRPGTYASTPTSLDIFTRGIRDADDPLGVRGPEHVRVFVEQGRIARVERLGGLAGIAIADTVKPARLEPVLVATFSDDQTVRRSWVPLTSIPRCLRDAVVASEDRRFYQHWGIDLRSNVRALLVNSKSGGVRQGASTITQQLARGLFLSRERSVFRKVREIFLALGLERVLSKDEILEMYLNSIYLGQEEAGGVAGVGEAARRYFDAPIETLELGQAAMLVGMIPAPNLYSPFKNPALAREKRNLVLNDMVQTGMISPDLAAVECARPLEVIAGKPKPGRFPSFTSYVHEYLRPRVPKGAAEHAGLSIYTTLDPVWQMRVEATLSPSVAELGIRDSSADSLEAAYVVLDPGTGAVRAMVGGRQDIPGGFNRAFQALRQPGSAIKPIVYSAALDPGRAGTAFAPNSTVPDRLRQFETAQGPWQPKNDEGEYHDQVTLVKALAKSLNVATANIVEAIGPRVVTRYGERFGLPGLKPVASVGLGTTEVTLVGLADAYTTFPNHGVRCDASPLRAVMGANGKMFCDVKPRVTRVIPEQTATLMTGMLEDVVIFGVSNPLRKKYGFTRPVAGKTGTTNDYHDAWFVGFTPDLVAGVWVGYDQPKTLDAPASETALPVWAKVTTKLLAGVPPTPFASDDSLQFAWIDPWSGNRATKNCPSVIRVALVPGTQPRDTCALDHTKDWEAKFAKRAADSLATLTRGVAQGVVRIDSSGASLQP